MQTMKLLNVLCQTSHSYASLFRKHNFGSCAALLTIFATTGLAAPNSPAPASVNSTPIPTPPDQQTSQKSSTKPPQVPTRTPAQVIESQNEKFEALESFSRVLNLLETSYVEKDAVDSKALVEKAIKGMVQGLDPHTSYLPSSQLRDLTNDTSGKFGGIGIVLSQQNGRLEIVEVMENSPASRAGIVSGDVIYSVEGVAVTQQNTEDVLNKMRGLPGSSLDLELLATHESKPPKNTERKVKTRKVTVMREVIKTSSVTTHKLSNGYAYARVSVFQEDSAENLDKALRKHEAESGGKLDGLILDLRNNPGGLLDQAVRIADLFLDAGIIVSTIGRDKSKQDVEYATKRTTHPEMPLVVLVNEGSASASEIVAGALQDHNRALIVGATTFGKGSVQSIVPLPNGAGLKMTIARYYTPKGRSIQAKGIVPDIPIASSTNERNKSNTAASANNSNGTNSESQSIRKEADLSGHIEANDLSKEAGLEGGFQNELEKWPATLKNDTQLRMAYTYLRSWARFKPKPSETLSSSKQSSETSVQR
jgi:carboxyl-terminal processing protease